MEDTIIALLNSNLRVIIPDFGAFIIRQKQPRIIVFNEFLRYNDGILIDFIVKTEGIDREIAEQRVMDFAEDGSKLLASGREMVIEGLGSLRKDSSGKINFIEAPEIIEIENKDTPEPAKVAAKEEKQEIPRSIEPEIQEKPEITETVEQEIPENIEIPQEIMKNIPKRAKPKATAATKSKVAKDSAKGKSVRTTKATPKTPKAGISVPSTEPATVEPKAYIEAAPVGPETAIEAAPVERELVPVEPETAIEAAPVERELAPVEPETAIEASTIPPQEVLDAAVVESQEAIEPGAIEIPQVFEPAVIESSRVTETASVPPPVSKPAQESETTGNVDRPAVISTNRILAWVLIILFANACILAWFVFRKKTQGTPAGKSATTFISDTLYDQLADSVRAAALDTSIVYNEVPDEEGNQNRNALIAGTRYYIVAGCFRDEVNADSLVSSLKLLGYKAEKFGKIGNLFAVCYASFDNKDKAVLELKKIREKVPSAWMTKF
jgi:hypothetical protein